MKKHTPLNLRLNPTGLVVYSIMLFVVAVASIFAFFLLFAVLKIAALFVILAAQMLVTNFLLYPFVLKRYGYKQK